MVIRSNRQLFQLTGMTPEQLRANRVPINFENDASLETYVVNTQLGQEFQKKLDRILKKKGVRH